MIRKKKSQILNLNTSEALFLEFILGRVVHDLQDYNFEKQFTSTELIQIKEIHKKLLHLRMKRLKEVYCN